MADDLEAALAKYRSAASQRDGEPEEMAVRWLRFWASKGRAVHAWW